MIATIENITGVNWALAALRINSDSYHLASEYYDGNHRLTFASDKFKTTFGRLFSELSINHCPVVVDVQADRLQVEGFAVVAQGEGEAAATAQAAQAKIAEIWRRNRMNKRAGEVHQESLKSGDSYVIVDWTDDIATIHPNSAGRCAVKYDDENPGYITQAAKWWPVEEGKKWRIRLNIYYRDRIEKYITEPRPTAALPGKVSEFKELPEALDMGDWWIPNKYDKVPVFHYANNAPIGSNGRSELKDIIAPQDGLNKAVCDTLIGAEVAALGQRYAIGLEIRTDDNGNPIPPFKSGVDKIWVVPPQTDESGKTLPADQAQPVTFGEFTAANLTQLLEIKAAFRSDISTISGIPSHYFMDDKGGWPSGESLKTSETRLAAKISDRQISYGNVWEDVMRFCLEIEGYSAVQVETIWKDTGPRTESEDIENAVQKVEKLQFSARTVQRELGYKDAEIDKMQEEKAGEALMNLRQSQTAIVPTVARSGAR